MRDLLKILKNLIRFINKMVDIVDGVTLSSKLKNFLNIKLDESKGNVIKLKKKQKIIKILYYSTTVTSIIISATLASISLMTIPPIIITILSTSNAILTAISIKFNIEDKSLKIDREITQLKKLKNKLEYVVSCNGNLTQTEYEQILSEFN